MQECEETLFEDPCKILTEVCRVMEDILDTLECDGLEHLVLSKNSSSVRLVPQKRKAPIPPPPSTEVAKKGRGGGQSGSQGQVHGCHDRNKMSPTSNLIDKQNSSISKVGEASAGPAGGATTLNSAASQLLTPILKRQRKDTTWTKLFVGGLSYHTTDKSLREYFKLYGGEIDEAVVITDRQTGNSRGYGFVIMADRLAAERACKVPNPIIDGRRVNVNLAILGAKPRRNPAVLTAVNNARATASTNAFAAASGAYQFNSASATQRAAVTATTTSGTGCVFQCPSDTSATSTAAALLAASHFGLTTAAGLALKPATVTTTPSVSVAGFPNAATQASYLYHDAAAASAHQPQTAGPYGSPLISLQQHHAHQAALAAALAAQQMSQLQYYDTNAATTPAYHHHQYPPVSGAGATQGSAETVPTATNQTAGYMVGFGATGSTGAHPYTQGASTGTTGHHQTATQAALAAAAAVYGGIPLQHYSHQTVPISTTSPAFAAALVAQQPSHLQHYDTTGATAAAYHHPHQGGVSMPGAFMQGSKP